MATDQYVAEIRFFPYQFTPTGWADCSGQVLPIQQYTALFSLLGTTYGGDGIRTFALPNLNARVPIGVSDGANGLSVRELGEQGGAEDVALTLQELPQHSHVLEGVAAAATANGVTVNEVPAQPRAGNIYGATGAQIPMASDMLQAAGGGNPHTNMQPYTTGRYCIALVGIFPPRP